MESETPLIKDLTTTFSNFDINSYFDSKIIEIHNNLINKKFEYYTNDEIYNYIKFINFTSSDIKYYKYIVKYINKYNLDYFYELFNNYDIFIELFYLLPYDIASCHKNFKNIKESWCERNFDKSSRYFDEFRVFLVYGTKKSNYYVINNKVYHKHTIENIFIDLTHIYDDKKLFENEKSYNKNIFTLITYMYEILYNDVNYNKKFNLLDNICKSIMINNLELLKYFVNRLKLENLNKSIYNNTYFYKYIEQPILQNGLDIIKYIINNIEVSENILNNIINLILSLAIENNKIDIVKYLVDLKNKNIKYNELLTISIRTNNFQITKLLVDNIINLKNNSYNLDNFKYNSISSCTDLNIIEYIINNLNIDINKIYLTFIKKNFEICKYIENNYEIDEKVSLINGNIKYIKNIENVNENIIYYNSEEVCIEFFKNISELSKIRKNKEFLKHCIYQGYFKLLMFIMDNINNIKIDEIILLVEYSKYESVTLEFIKFLLNKKYDMYMNIIILNLINKGYLETLKYLYDEILFNINIYIFIYESIKCVNIDIFEYLISLKLHGINDIKGLFEPSIKLNNFKMLKYLIDKFDFLILLSFKIFLIIDETNYNNYIDIIKYVADKGADINIDLLEKFCIYNEFDVLDYLLNIVLKVNKNPLSILIMRLIKLNEINSIKHLLENYGNYIKPKCKALRIACNKNNYYLSNMLIKYIKPANDMLIKAYNNNYLDIIILLIENGMDINLLKEHIKDEKIEINNYLFDNGLVI